MEHDDATDANWKSINIDLNRIAERLDHEENDLVDAAGGILSEYCAGVDRSEASGLLAVELYAWAGSGGFTRMGPVALAVVARDHRARLEQLHRIVNKHQHRISRHGTGAFSLDTTKRNSKQRMMTLFDGFEGSPASANAADARPSDGLFAKELADFLRVWSDDARALVTAVYLDGTPIRLIAEESGCGVRAVQLRLQRACLRLRRDFDSRHRKPTLGDAASRPGEAGQGGFVGHDEGDQNGEENQAEHHERPGRLVERPGRTLRTPARRRVHRRDRQRHEQHERPAPRPQRPEHGFHGCASCTRAADGRPHVDKGTLRVEMRTPIARHRCAA
ncbi:MAG TPA: hypothetical protein PLU35_01735 [Phycisphaerales bacterium]|nr:hypothetical protein [Phycisphaerales bacterium]